MVSGHKKAKPFIKWAGGKSQLLPILRKHYPTSLGENIIKYCEPFIGGGAVLFDILKNYKLKDVLINDINPNLINTYKCVRDDINDVVNLLKDMELEYLCGDNDARSNYYYSKRDIFNTIKNDLTMKNSPLIAALFIFLNKTCFNGLYRVNANGCFNVPTGNYKNPVICDEDTLRMASYLLSNVEMTNGSYKNCANFIDEKTFVYLDPPYRPISQTAGFTSYSTSGFNDQDQRDLGLFVQEMDTKNATIVLSNSDPKNTNDEDTFFDDLYSKFFLSRVDAKRMINSNATKRGVLSELLISNKSLHSSKA